MMLKQGPQSLTSYLATQTERNGSDQATGHTGILAGLGHEKWHEGSGGDVKVSCIMYTSSG